MVGEFVRESEEVVEFRLNSLSSPLTFNRVFAPLRVGVAGSLYAKVSKSPIRTASSSSLTRFRECSLGLCFVSSSPSASASGSFGSDFAFEMPSNEGPGSKRVTLLSNSLKREVRRVVLFTSLLSGLESVVVRLRLEDMFVLCRTRKCEIRMRLRDGEKSFC